MSDGIDKTSVHSDIPPERQAAYDVVFKVIAAIPSRAASEYDQVCENGRVWRAVEAALDAFQAKSAARTSLLEERIRKVREICGGIECPNCDHPVKLHDNRLGTCDANLNSVLGPCGCDWSSSIAEDIRAALDGAVEERGRG